MELSPAERLILAGQCKILEALHSDDPEEVKRYAVYRKALEEGYVLEYKSIFGAERFAPELPAEACQEVRDIFALYRALQQSHAKLEDGADLSLGALLFEGFDENREYVRTAYVRYLVKCFPEYAQVRRGKENSGRPMMPRYRAMLREWEGLGKKSRLTADDIKRILSAKPAA